MLPTVAFAQTAPAQTDQNAQQPPAATPGEPNATPQDTGEIVDFAGQQPLGPCPKCGAPVYEHGSNYVCSKAVPTLAQPTPSCDFKSGQIILQQPIERE